MVGQRASGLLKHQGAMPLDIPASPAAGVWEGKAPRPHDQAVLKAQL